MKNACRINDDGSVSILLNLKGGDNLEAIVTKEHYEKYAEPFGGTWIPYKHPRTGKYYARGARWRNPKTGDYEQPMLHRLIMKPGKGDITAHKDHNTLNCLPSNMINIPIGADLDTYLAGETIISEVPVQITVAPGPKGEAIIEETPIQEDLNPLKGVSLHKVKQRWEVSPFYEGKRYRLGYWDKDDLAGANNAVQEFREIGPDQYFINHPKKKGR